MSPWSVRGVAGWGRSVTMPRREQPTLPLGRYFKVSTAVVAPGDRRAFWRDTALNRTDADFPADGAPRGFSAQVRGYVGATGELREGRSDAVIMRRSAARCRQDGIDEIMLSFLVDSDGPGQYRRGDTVFSVPIGGVTVNDSAVPFTVDMQRYRSINYRLPRSAVASAIGGDPGILTGRLLSTAPLNRLLSSHLMQLVDTMEEMDDAERQVALDVATDFALAALRLEARGGEWEDGAHGKGLRQAAQRFIEGNLHRQDLNPDMLARALRCSRTHLYRLFSSNGETVMGYVREVRLARSRAMLADAASRLTIGEIALHCGFDDPSGFSRSFRGRYGCPPGEVRRELRESRR
jgi:AraC family transcriptional activator of tynA and feaB